ncbi:MAG: carbohydrate kinase family protein [Patescibacteria group bacterium]|jgi:sugar/nucleoside kinase (ribokinase family)
MKYDIITIGGAIRDIIFYTNEGLVVNNPNPLCEKLIAFELGAKIYTDEAYWSWGGGADNTGVGVAKLGLKTAIIVRVGADSEGDELVKYFKKQGIETKFIQRDKNIRTGFSLVTTLKNKKAHTIFVYRGPGEDLNSLPKNISAKWIYISSLSAKYWEKMMNQILKYKAIKAWNPSIVQLKTGYSKLSKYLKQIDVLILNEDEARELVLSAQKTKDLSIKHLLKRIYQMGPKIVAITAGPKGVFAYNGDKFYSHKIKKAKVVNTVGAGDAFSSGFIAGLFYDKNNIQKALHWGILNSASVIAKIGAQEGLLNKSNLKF